jgi:hypothetical protein
MEKVMQCDPLGYKGQCENSSFGTTESLRGKRFIEKLISVLGESGEFVK